MQSSDLSRLKERLEMRRRRRVGMKLSEMLESKETSFQREYKQFTKASDAHYEAKKMNVESQSRTQVVWDKITRKKNKEIITIEAPRTVSQTIPEINEVFQPQDPVCVQEITSVEAPKEINDKALKKLSEEAQDIVLVPTKIWV